MQNMTVYKYLDLILDDLTLEIEVDNFVYLKYKGQEIYLTWAELTQRGTEKCQIFINLINQLNILIPSLKEQQESVLSKSQYC